MPSLTPFRSESIFKCSAPYLARVSEYYSKLEGKPSFDELISEGEKIWRGETEYQARSQEFRSEILKVIVAGTVLSATSDTFRERLLGWPIEGRGKGSVRSRPSVLVARRILQGASKQVLQNYADAADEVIALGVPMEELGRSGRGNLIALARAFRKRRDQLKPADTAQTETVNDDADNSSRGVAEQDVCLPGASDAGAVSVAPAETPALTRPASQPRQELQAHDIVLTLDAASHKKFIESRTSGKILTFLVRPRSDGTATGKLIHQFITTHKQTRIV